MLSLIVTLPNEQPILISEAIVRWSRGQEFAVENLMINSQPHARLSPTSNDWSKNRRRLSYE
jgi:hypothetical protein